MESANYYEDLDDQEFRALEESWCSNDFLSRYEDLQDKIVLGDQPDSWYNRGVQTEEQVTQ